MTFHHAFAAALCATASLLAQDSYWIANHGSSDLMRVSGWGSVLARVPVPPNPRAAYTAPDGKVWVTFYNLTAPTGGPLVLHDPATNTTTTLTSPGPQHYAVAFDAAGRAFVTSGLSDLHEFTANGTFVQTHALTAPLSLELTIDASGNKWVAHYSFPARVSRVSSLGVVTQHVLSGTSAQFRPLAIAADHRGVGNPSRIWVLADLTPQIAELDANGTTLNVHNLGATSLRTLAADAQGHLWAGSSSGALLRIDRSTGGVTSFSVSPPSQGLAIDDHGRVLSSGDVAAGPCVVRRLAPGTAQMEHPGRLAFGTALALGTRSAASTALHHSLVVDPTGDTDGDGATNLAEVQARTSPVDPAASPAFRVASFGRTATGSSPTFDVLSTLPWVVGFSTALVPATTLPGFSGSLRLDLTTLVSTAGGVGNAQLPLAVPANPALAGFEFFAQGVTVNGSSFAFRNVTGMLVW